ncbi:MAG: archaemetzincin family Zn-dependent metalloprotease [Planctomycetota bacterium]|jgi:archaemetzincin
MSIVLIAVGKVDKEIFEVLKDNLRSFFKRRVAMGKTMPEPYYALNKGREQYLATAILNAIMDEREYAGYERVLGVFDHDLYASGLNFVFGQAAGKAAVISLARLGQGFYGLPEDRGLFHKRAFTEAVHELGHTYGLGHCRNPRCVMFFFDSLIDTDRKGPGFCPVCKDRLSSPAFT